MPPIPLPSTPSTSQELLSADRLELLSKPELTELAKILVVQLPSRCRKDELIALILEAQARRMGVERMQGMLDVHADGFGFLRRPGAAAFDMEGSPTQKTTLVERGILKSFIYDSYFGARENRLSTGNYIRDFDHEFPGGDDHTLH